MTEQEWLTATELTLPMLRFLRSKMGARKARLFGCAYVRRIWSRLPDCFELCEAVVVAERFADRETNKEKLHTAHLLARDAAEQFSSPALAEPVWQAVATVVEDDFDFFDMTYCEVETAGSEPDIVNSRTRPQILERRTTRFALYLKLLREVIGNRLNPVTLDRSWLTSNLTSLALSVYDNRQLPSGLFDNQRMAVLADALEDAGCDNADILGHLRAGGDHVRGCWAVDLVLGKT